MGVTGDLGAGVNAVFSGTGAGTALKVTGGAIRVGGAIVPAFQQKFLLGDACNDERLYPLSNPLLDGDPDAMIQITPLYDFAYPLAKTPAVTYTGATPPGNCPADRWAVAAGDGGKLPGRLTVNVLVIGR